MGKIQEFWSNLCRSGRATFFNDQDKRVSALKGKRKKSLIQTVL